MTASKQALAAAMIAGLALPSSASVVGVSYSVPSLHTPAAVNSALPASMSSLPLDIASLSLSPSLTPAPSPLPSAQALGSLNNFWDGLGIPAQELDEPSAIAVPQSGFSEGSIDDAGERLAPWLATNNANVAAALDRAVTIARATRAGRRALDTAEKTLAAEGRTLPVLVLDLGRNHGEYDYLEKNMRLHSALFKKGREAELAGTIVHELTHVAQHAQGVPAHALEMEIEAHLQDLEMLAELGVEPAKGTFARQALERLAQGPARFIELIQAAVPGSLFLGESSLDELEEQMEEDLASHRGRAKRSKAAAALADVLERDLASLRTPEGAASYCAFSKRVLALLRRRSAAAAKSRLT